MSNGLFEKGNALMALDVGTKRIGIALCDPMHMVVTPLETLHRKKFTPDAQYLIKLIKDWNIKGLVVGLPLNMDGTEGVTCQSVRDFIKNLERLEDWPTTLAITFQDERLTSIEAETALIDEMDVSRKKRIGAVDQLAAMTILKRFLNN